jgi:hypothetical protein
MPDVLPPAPDYGFGPSPSQSPAPQEQGNGIAVAGMVLGILALVLCWVMFVNFVLGVLGIVFGALGMAKAKRIGGKNRGLALAGLVTGILGIVAGVLVFVVVMSAFNDYLDKGKSSLIRVKLMRLADMRYSEWAMEHPDKACPSSLAEIEPDAMERTDSWGHEFKMVCGPDAPPGVHGIGVYSLGEDGIDGTPDDIKSWEHFGRR